MIDVLTYFPLVKGRRLEMRLREFTGSFRHSTFFEYCSSHGLKHCKYERPSAGNDTPAFGTKACDPGAHELEFSGFDHIGISARKPEDAT